MARWSPRRRRRATEYREERVTTAPPPKPRPFWPWLLLLLLLVLGALGASYYFANRGETVDAAEVPNVVGAQRGEAERRLEEREFVPEVDRVVSERPPGTVIAQRPEPGTLYGEGGIVVLAVARDPLRTEIPDVSGLRTPRALARLRAAELRPRAQAVPSQEPRGTVLRQLPPAGTEVPTGSPAIVVVSSGPDLGTVPDVVGTPVGQATSQLAQADFRVRVVQVASSDEEGTVVAQNPVGGGRARRGTVVRLNVSRGQGHVPRRPSRRPSRRPRCPTPSDRTRRRRRPRWRAPDSSLRVVDQPTTSPEEEGIVVRQAPAGDGSARTGSTVTIFVGRLS